MPALSATTATNVDILDVVRTKFRTQVELARSRGIDQADAAPNDSAARTAFLLLGDRDRRTLFRELLSDVDAVRRIRHLVGAPPFSFLCTGENDGLDASRFGKRRINLSFADRLLAPPRTQFGPGEFLDEKARKYRRVDGQDRQLQVCRESQRWPVPGETVALRPSREWRTLVNSNVDDDEVITYRVTGLAARGSTQTALLSVATL